jgi:hypothetical protein
MRVDVAIPPGAPMRVEHRTGVNVGSYPDLRDVRLIIGELHLSLGGVQGHSDPRVAAEQIRSLQYHLTGLLQRVESKDVEL